MGCVAGQRQGQAVGNVGRRPAGHDLDQDSVQVGTQDGFVQEAQPAGPAACPVVGIGIGRAQHHDRRSGHRRLGADGIGQRHTVHARHVHVQNRQSVGPAISASLCHRVQRLLGAGHTLHCHLPAAELVQQDIAAGLVVIHDQHPHAIQPGGTEQRGGCLAGMWQAQINDERRALAERTLHPNGGAHQPQQSLADRQPQASATELARGRAVGLRELLEDPPVRRFVDADAGVAHGDAHAGVVLAALQHLDAQQNLALGGELDRIAQQVADDLTQAEGVAAQHRGGVVGRDLDRQLQSLGLGRLGKHRHRLFCRLDDVEVNRLQLKVTRLDLGEIQDVVDHSQQMLTRRLHRLGPAALHAVELAAEQQFIHAQHTVHRGANFVAHGRQEFALGTAGGLGRVFGAQQFRGPPGDFAFELIALLGQALVTHLNVTEHRVEALRQRVQLGDVACLGAQTEIGPVSDTVHQPGQTEYGPEHPGVQSQQQQMADPHRQHPSHQPGQGLLGSLDIQVPQVNSEVNRALDLLGKLNRLGDVQVLGSVAGVRTERGQGVGQAVVRARIAGKWLAVCAIDRCSMHLGRVVQRFQQVHPRLLILQHQRWAGVFGQHLGQHLSGLPQCRQAGGEVGDYDQQRRQRQCRAQRQTIVPLQTLAQRAWMWLDRIHRIAVVVWVRRFGFGRSVRLASLCRSTLADDYGDGDGDGADA